MNLEKMTEDKNGAIFRYKQTLNMINEVKWVC